jgi:phenylalanyl-tRNA synthetase alpha subunit|tara:strand:+ start:499 stop:894 length:396 start_codon:yes stop_codon:yes gene_type:complete
VEKLLKLMDEVAKDLVLDDFNIKEVTLRLPARKHYWVAQLIKTKISRNQTFVKKRELKKNITREVIATSPVKLTQSAAEQAAERHDTLAELNNKIREFDVIIEYLEKVEKVMSQMGFDVKNAVDIMKMEQM